MLFVQKEEIPKSRWSDITYGRIVLTYRLHKTEPNRSRLTVGGDRINYPYKMSTPIADLTTIKMLWNSTLSTKDAKLITMDVVNFELRTPMSIPELMHLSIKLIPQEIINKYNLDAMDEDGWVYFRIVKGIYGLLHAEILSNSLL